LLDVSRAWPSPDWRLESSGRACSCGGVNMKSRCFLTRELDRSRKSGRVMRIDDDEPAPMGVWNDESQFKSVRSRPLDEASRSVSISGKGLMGGELALAGTDTFSFSDDQDPNPFIIIIIIQKSN